MRSTDATVDECSDGRRRISTELFLERRGSNAVADWPDIGARAILFTDAVGQVNQLEDQARVAVDGLMTGAGVDVHQAMIATQKASMAFELALAVRNKAVQAYQQVIGMQF